MFVGGNGIIHDMELSGNIQNVEPIFINNWATATFYLFTKNSKGPKKSASASASLLPKMH